MKHGNENAVGAHREFFKMIFTKNGSKMAIIDRLLEAKILPPPTQDVIFRRHTRRQYDQHGGDSDDEDETASSSSEDSADDDGTRSSDDSADQHGGWHAPYQILWDTPPTHNRTKTEMV